MKTDWSKIDWSQVPPPPDTTPVPLFHLRSSDNQRHYRFLKQLVRDGVELNGILKNEDNIPTLDIKIERTPNPHFVWLFPKVEQFLLKYLLSGENSDFPVYPNDGYLPDFRADDNYIDRHIKKELERGKYTCNEETQDGINGIRFIGNYPYGNIDYGFLPYSFEELKARLENVEAFYYDYPEHDIHELNNNTLPIEYRDLEKDKHLDSIFDEIPTNVIIDKTICGCGATWLEIHSKRNSIIIEPNVPVIIGKVQKHHDINIIGVHGDTIKVKDITEKIQIQNQNGYVKIMTTPESYKKVTDALKLLNIQYRKDYFLLFDECEKIVSDIDYRPNIALPIKDFFKFDNKAMVSATPIIINDPRFKEQKFKIIKIKPQFDYKRLLELKPTNSIRIIKRVRR